MPTALHEVAELHDTPESMSEEVPGLGLVETDHV